MAGSINMVGRDIEFNIKVGDRKILEIVITDQNGVVQDLTSTVTYSTAVWKVWKPDGTLIINGSATYSDRANGKIQYSLSTADTAAANAGRWAGEVEMLDSSGVKSDQSETFNFVINPSY